METRFVTNILEKKLHLFRQQIVERLDEIREMQLVEAKRLIGAQFSVLCENLLNEQTVMSRTGQVVKTQFKGYQIRRHPVHNAYTIHKPGKEKAIAWVDKLHDAYNKIDQWRIHGYKTEEAIYEANVVRQGRIKLIRRRFRHGKLQRMVRKSAIKGFILRGRKLVRIPASKRIRMRIVQKRAARKRRARLAQSLRKRKITLRKRKAMGIKP